MKRAILIIGILVTTFAPFVSLAAPTFTTADGKSPCDYNTNPETHICWQGGIPTLLKQDGTAYGPVDAAHDLKNDLTNNACFSFTKGLNILQCAYGFGTIIANLFLAAAVFFLALSGTLLDAALQITFSMGRILMTKAISDAIVYGWTIFRDIGNLALIAGLIWASISMILGIQAAGQAPGKLVSNIIIVAILVNFSYFFAGVLVDASNSLSSVIYTQGIKGVAVGVVPADSTLPQLGDFQGISITNTAFAGLFIDKTKLVSLVHQASTQTKSKPLLTIITLGYAITLIGMTAVIFTEAAFLVVARFAILILLLVSSPAFVLGFTNVPELKEWGDWWWKTLVSQLTFLPIFMLLMMISLTTIGKVMDYAFARNNATLGTTMDAIANGNSGGIAAGIEVSIFFFISIALLQISIKVARDLASGAKTKLPNLGQFQQMASQFGQNTGKLGQKYVAGLPQELAKLGYGRLERYLPDTSGAGRGLGRGVRSIFGGRKQVDRERREENRTKHELDEAYGEIAEWQNLRKNATTAQEREAADEGLRKAKAKRDAALKEYHERFGDRKTADRVSEIGKTAGKAAYDKAIKGGKTKEEAEEEAKKARLDAEDAALKALGDKAPGVERLMGRGGGSSSTTKESGRPKVRATAAYATVAEAQAAMTPGNIALAERMARGEEQAVAEFKVLEYLERQRILVARREILADKNNTKILADALGRDKINEHIRELPDERVRDVGVLTSTAPHMTFETYKSTLKRLEGLRISGASMMMFRQAAETNSDPETAEKIKNYIPGGSSRFK